MKTINIIYVHGVGGENSSKYEHLKKYFTADKYKVTKLTQDANSPRKTYELLNQAVDSAYENNECVFLVGSSRGGLISHIVSMRRDIPCLLINPALDPNGINYDKVKLLNVEDTSKYLEEMEFLHNMLENDCVDDFHWTNLFLSINDDIVDPELTLQKLPTRNSLYINKDSHRFESFPKLLHKVEEMIDYYYCGNKNFSFEFPDLLS